MGSSRQIPRARAARSSLRRVAPVRCGRLDRSPRVRSSEGGPMTGARMNTSVLKGHDLKDALARACAHVGIVNKDVPPDGRWHRSDVLGGNNGKGDASIKLFFDGKGGMVRNWKGEDCLFFADDAHALSEAELIE